MPWAVVLCSTPPQRGHAVCCGRGVATSRRGAVRGSPTQPLLRAIAALAAEVDTRRPLQHPVAGGQRRGVIVLCVSAAMGRADRDWRC